MRLYKIYFTIKVVAAENWQCLFEYLNLLSKIGDQWQIYVTHEKLKLRFYLKTKLALPADLKLPEFLFQPTSKELSSIPRHRGISLRSYTNFLSLKDFFEIKKDKKFCALVINFIKFSPHKFLTWSYYCSADTKYYLPITTPSTLLAIDFADLHHLLPESTPKYLQSEKIIPYLVTDSNSAIFEVDPFPFNCDGRFLGLPDLDFAKHSLVLGASGSGKSKFLSLLTQSLAKNSSEKYKVVVIDPHAAMEKDVGGYGKVIDFQSTADSISLFASQTKDLATTTELLLELFQNLLSKSYNAKLDRVLRHSISLLTSFNQFNFQNLHKLLLDLDYRRELLGQSSSAPSSSVTFFLTEYNEIRTSSYTEAISPIIALIDEIEMIPVLNQASSMPNLRTVVQDNFLTLFSFDRSKLGDRVTNIIAGIIMQQLFTAVQDATFKEHIIFIVDEVSVVEQPILKRFLAEARKFNLSVILSSQYFGGISKALQSAILANVINYYLFRVSKDDAMRLSECISYKIPLDDTAERKTKTLTDLQNRECIIRPSSHNKLIPAFKAMTVDFTPCPRIVTSPTNIIFAAQQITQKVLDFAIGSATKFQQFLTAQKFYLHRKIGAKK